MSVTGPSRGLDGPLEVVTSTANPRVKEALALTRRKQREASGAYLVEGLRAVVELLGDHQLERVFALPEVAVGLAGACARGGAQLVGVDERVLRRLADTKNPQGVVGVAHQRRADLEAVVGRGTLVVLCTVGDPGNAGTAIRTAASAGAAGVVLTEGSVDPWNPKSVRASAGTVARAPLVVGVTPEQVVSACRRVGQRCVALDAGGERSLFEPGVVSPPVALIFGSEAHGLPASVRAAADVIAAIPRFGPAESLNLGAAVAVAVYEAARS